MIYFVSDIHLGFYKREIDKTREDIFIAWLNDIEENCSELVLLGDIFDFWFEYTTVIPKFFYRTLAIFDRFIKKGIKIEYLMGNHDFGHNNFFSEELGINIVKNDITKEYFSKKFYLSHGDGKSHKDISYLMLKKILRNKTCQKLYCTLHPDIGIKLAANSSRWSRNTTNKKDFGNKDGMLEFAEKKILENYDYIVMGHRHIVCNESISRHNGTTGNYINLGSWLSNPHYGTFDGKAFKLHKVAPNLLSNNK